MLSERQFVSISAMFVSVAAAAAAAAAVVDAATDIFSNIMHDDHEIFSLFYACSSAVVVVIIDYITHVYISCVQSKKLSLELKLNHG